MHNIPSPPFIQRAEQCLRFVKWPLLPSCDGYLLCDLLLNTIKTQRLVVGSYNVFHMIDIHVPYFAARGPGGGIPLHKDICNTIKTEKLIAECYKVSLLIDICQILL